MSPTSRSGDVQGEQQKLSYYHRNLARQQQQLAQWLQKRCGGLPKPLVNTAVVSETRV